jgi:CubicO group peptidase (beta-lactamase class C family)
MLVHSALALMPALALSYCTQGLHLQIPLSLESSTGNLDASISEIGPAVSNSVSPCEPLQTGQLISECTERYIDTVLTKWNSSGLAIAVVRRSASGEWTTELGGYGIATADGNPVTPDTLFAIASNSKLFLSLSVGLLIKNETLAKERGKNLDWTTQIRDVIPEWGLMDEEADRGTTLLDMLSHRTGLPRHDFAGTQRPGGVAEMVRFQFVNLRRSSHH